MTDKKWWCACCCTSPETWWNFCPICGKPRPEEKKVELPEKFQDVNCGDYYSLKVNKLIDYLASKPWDSK